MKKVNWTTVPNPTADDRKYLTSLSTYAGSGQYAQHHLGHTLRQWDHLKMSVAHLMNQNLFGMQSSGANICGVSTDTNNPVDEKTQESICSRWAQMSSFIPMAKVHRKNGIGIEPFEIYDAN